jgi:hypothetical protein
MKVLPRSHPVSPLSKSRTVEEREVFRNAMHFLSEGLASDNVPSR